jgi:hypothetical protein
MCYAERWEPTSPRVFVNDEMARQYERMPHLLFVIQNEFVEIARLVMISRLRRTNPPCKPDSFRLADYPDTPSDASAFPSTDPLSVAATFLFARPPPPIGWQAPMEFQTSHQRTSQQMAHWIHQHSRFLSSRGVCCHQMARRFALPESLTRLQETRYLKSKS